MIFLLFGYEDALKKIIIWPYMNTKLPMLYDHDFDMTPSGQDIVFYSDGVFLCPCKTIYLRPYKFIYFFSVLYFFWVVNVLYIVRHLFWSFTLLSVYSGRLFS